MSAPSTPAAPTDSRRYHIRPLTLLSLLAGRGTYRLVQLLTTVLLLMAWGEPRYQVYAAAMSSFSWLTALVFTGPEKTVLKLLPRAPRTGPMITEALLAVVWLMPIPLVVAFAVSLGLWGEAVATIYLGVAAMLLGSGCTMLLVGLHRALGRPWPDVGSFLVLSLLQVGLLAACLAGWLGPPGYITAVIVTQSVVNAVLAVQLGRPTLRIRHRAGYLRRIIWTVVLMSGGEVCVYLSSGVMFNLLAFSRWSWQLSQLFVVITVWSVAFNLLLYVLRVFAPRVSLRLAGRASRSGRQRAARVASGVVVADVAWLALAGWGLSQFDLAAVTAKAGFVFWAALMVSRAPAMMILAWAGYLLENTDARAPRITGLAAAVNLGITALVGMVAVPAWGGVGIVVGLAVAELGQAVVLALGARGGFGRWRLAPASPFTGSVRA